MQLMKVSARLTPKEWGNVRKFLNAAAQVTQPVDAQSCILLEATSEFINKIPVYNPAYDSGVAKKKAVTKLVIKHPLTQFVWVALFVHDHMAAFGNLYDAGTLTMMREVLDQFGATSKNQLSFKYQIKLN